MRIDAHHSSSEQYTLAYLETILKRNRFEKSILVGPLQTVPDFVGTHGDAWAGMNDSPQSLEPLLERSARDMAAGLMDAPWPPVYPKMPNEPPRVAPSRARPTPDS